VKQWEQINTFFHMEMKIDKLSWCLITFLLLLFLCRQISGISFLHYRKYKRIQIVIPQIQPLSKSKWSLREADLAAN
jgi:hypothetical protein